MAVTLIIYFYLPKSIQEVQRGVLIERAHYYTILVEVVRTIREGVLIEEGALTEVVQYCSLQFFLKKNLQIYARALQG